jgi:N-acetylglucosaminyl-diphospho-decaprenol L-rhamnosyltransferase
LQKATLMATASTKALPWARIVIVDYRSGEHLQACIEALKTQTFDNFEAIIVDNDCPLGAARALTLPDDRFRVMSSPNNLGYAGGSNLGARGAETPWLIMLNPDAAPDPNWLAALKQATETYSDSVMFGTTLIQADDPARLDGYGDVLSIFGVAWRGGTDQSVSQAPDHDLDVFGPCGAGAMYRRDIFDAMGGFEERFFCYLEDVDLAWRIGRQGGRCVQVKDARASHVGGVSSQDQPAFPLYHSARNAVWMIAGTAPLALVVPMLLLNLFARIYLILRGSYGPSWRAVLRGVRDGWLGIGPHLFTRRRQARQYPRLGDAPRNAAPIWSVAALRESRIVGTKAKPTP